MKPGGVLEHENGWSGGMWKFNPEGKVEMEFNGVHHTMILSADNKNLMLIKPFRNPPSVATFLKAIGATGGYWTEHENIDMCGQGDMELVHNWKENTSIEALK